MSLRCFMAFLLSLAAVCSDARESRVNPPHPEGNGSLPGHARRDSSGRFPENPWDRPAGRQRDLEIVNADRIDPGDVPDLVETNGAAHGRIENPSVIRLSPRIRIDTTPPAIPTIRMAAIRPFLSDSRVLTEAERTSSPAIVGLEEGRILGGDGDLVYVRSIPAPAAGSFSVFRAGPAYLDGDTGELLGYEGIYVADAQLRSPGDPATLQLIRGDREAWIGDQVLPMRSEETELQLRPRVTERPVRGHIISVLDGVYEIGQYNVVAVDRGSRDGIQVGDVFDIVQGGTELRDVYSHFGNKILSPEQKAGSLMIFRVFERVGYALVLNATRAVHVLDLIQTP